MNEQQLLAELRNALQATNVIDHQNTDGTTSRITVLSISDETQRKAIADKYAALLLSVTPVVEKSV